MKKKKVETPEDRFKDFLTKKSEIIAMVKPGESSGIIIFNKDKSRTIVRTIVDKNLENLNLTNAEKIEFLFEKDYPNRKAIEHGDTTALFRAWLNRKHFNDEYFKYGDLK